MRKLIAFLTGGQLVRLEDFQNEVYETIAYRDYLRNCYYARVYWYDKVGHVILLDGGDVDARSKSSYIHNWREG